MISSSNKNFIGIILIVIIVLIGGVLFFQNSFQVEVITDKTEYKQGEDLKLRIENQLKETICFSSCYPYLFERKDEDEWSDYNYKECDKENLNQKCLDSKAVIAFEIPILIDGGIHRISLPACVGCRFNEKFQETEKFYSNQFNIE